MSIYDSLNPNQQQAVYATEGPVLLLAGAGSGKTRVLTHRIAYLIEEKEVNPYNILAITFTNKAAQEMRDRVNRLIGGTDASMVWVSTFHSMCVRILRRYIDRLGYDNNFTIYDMDDAKTVVKAVMKRLKIDTKQFGERAVLSEISGCKNKFVSAEGYREAAEDYREKKIALIFGEYQKELKKNNALDFDDLLVKTVELFEQFPDVLGNYQRRFRYIHVDEYQDTNGVQFRLISQLAGAHGNLCVVGDDDQSIYKFRGADISNILDFEKTFPGAVVIKLEQNYRSTPNILEVANAVISHNRGRKDKRLWSARPQGERVKYQLFADSRQEARSIVNSICANHTMGEQYRDIAILYRTNAQSRAFEEECLMRNVPYRIVGGVNFYQRAEIKDILAYLKTIDNGSDDLALRRIINVPRRGIGDTTVDRVAEFASGHGISMMDALLRVDEISAAARAAAKLKDFAGQIQDFRKNAQLMRVSDLIEKIMADINYEAELGKLDKEQAETKRDNLQELMNKAAEYEENCENEDVKPTLTGFLEEIALVADIDNTDDSDEKVMLMTLHGAKGLEFSRVYLCGMEEELFPSSQAVNSDDPDDIEEERRLAYVGITRAKDHLTLTGAKMRLVHGETWFHKQSRFIKEIPDGMIDVEVPGMDKPKPHSNINHFTRPAVKTYRTSQERSSFGKDVSELVKKRALDYAVGDRVFHSSFGVGTVLAIDEKPRDFMVTVDFDSCGIKKMMAGFAKLVLQK